MTVFAIKTYCFELRVLEGRQKDTILPDAGARIARREVSFP
jgi:hypothetical protein